MHPTPRDRRPPLLRLMALLVLLPSLTLAGLQAAAAIRPKLQSPHGDLKEECSSCHSAKGWKPAVISASFDHARSGFALTGAHATGDCMSCHTSLDFKAERTQCQSCHTDPHRGEMGADCARCHSSRSFIDRGPMVRLHQMTRFSLTGSHAALECESCHAPAAQGQLQFVNTRAECQSCHMEAYRATREPDHAAGGFPLACQQCHSTLTWSTARFDHDRSAFPLTGAHRTAACAQCHGDGVYQGKPTACASCHQGEYNSTTAPAHAAAGFPAQCQVCHNTVAWQPTAYDHDATAFPLTGAHRSATCDQCHGDGVYDGKPTACESCHQGDYDSTTDPSHAAAQFPLQCLTCHNTTAWAPASWDHDSRWFPIYSGRHRGEWNACSDCHNNPNDFNQFNCLSCHPHSDRTKTDGDHRGESGYQYQSAACYSCHPRGNS